MMLFSTNPVLHNSNHPFFPHIRLYGTYHFAFHPRLSNNSYPSSNFSIVPMIVQPISQFKTIIGMGNHQRFEL